MILQIILLSILLYLSFIAKGLAICQLGRVITTQKVLFYSLKLTFLNTFKQQLIAFNSIDTLMNLERVTNNFFGKFQCFQQLKSMAMQVETQIHEEFELWSTSQPFAKLGNRLPSQSEMQERKPEEEIQQPTFSHGYAKISHNMRNQEEEQLQD